MIAREFTFKGPLFRTDESAAYLNYRGKHALRSLYRFVEKRGVPTSRRFRTVLIKKSDLDKAIGCASKKVAVESASAVHGQDSN